MIVALVGLAGCAGSTGPDSPVNPAGPARPAPPAEASSSPSPSPTHSLPHHYVFPVRGCSSSPSSSHHDYPASDIFTQRGCRFVAVVRGTVDEVHWHDKWDPSVDSGATRGGRSISIVGDDGVRYYGSHLLRIAKGIKPGVRVKAGTVLGRIDNSGDAKYTPTHVHFGISWPTRNGIWWVRRGEVWPQKYLADWRGGGHLSPRKAVHRAERRMGKVPKCHVEC
jgi:murein DD-endopeptidase MepM/ murein hydrolase activator NlpD